MTPRPDDDLPGGPHWTDLPELLTAPVGRWVARRTLAALALSSPADPVEEAAGWSLAALALGLLMLLPWVAPETCRAAWALVGGAS